MNRIEQHLKACDLCPRQCGVNRMAGQTGYCGEGSEVMAARAALHYWEEPCISGAEGSGTVFFSGCTLRCIFCQNREIAAGKAGQKITVGRLSEIFLELQEKGANNINLVTPTHYAPHIIEALDLAKGQGLKLPVLYNTGGYERVEILRELDPYIDIYMPDFKYFFAETAKNFSRAEDYCSKAMDALAEMVRQKGAPRYNEKGMLVRGVLVRHLVLPGHTEESRKVIQYLWETYGGQIVLSIMNQYTPISGVELPKELRRPLTRGEYKRVVDYAAGLGITQAYIQTGETCKESFIPPFTGEGL